MYNFRFLFFVLIFLGVSGCIKSPKHKGVAYVFPEKTIISEVEDACFKDSGGKWLKKGKEAEDAILGMFTDEVPVSQQKVAGDKIFTEIQSEFKINSGEEAHRLEKMLNKMKKYIARKDISYKVYLIEDEKNINAFTVPGGNIYVTTALMKFVESEDELAVILGHEIGHNENKHTNGFLKKQNIAAKIVGEDAGEIVASLASLLTMSFGQPQELEADRCGLYLAYSAGYDPAKGIAFFERIGADSNTEEAIRFISTHPYPSERAHCMERYLTAAKQ